MKELEQFLKELAISDHAKITLLSLMKKKEKENKMQQLLNRVGVASIIVIVFFGAYLYYQLKMNHGIGSSALTFILNDIILLILFVKLAVLLYTMFFFKKKFDKAEKDVDKIRFDIMERSPDFWGTKEELDERYKVFKYLKDKEDINLFHK